MMKVKIGKYHKNGADRKINIQIDKYDAWNLDHTLALIIHPALIIFKENSVSYGLVENDDVPESFRTEGEVYDIQKWNWVLDELIWTFGKIINEEDRYTDVETEKRISNGLRLFGKYYSNLWD